MTDVSTDGGQALAQARALLNSTTHLIDRALSALKAKTLDGERVSPALLDEHQLISYDLSLIWSECIAARFLLDHAGRLEAESGELNSFTTRLAAMFCGEAVTNCVNRLRARPADFNLTDDDIATVTAAPDAAAFALLGALG